MSAIKSKIPHKYKCCFCQYFQLEGHRWGYCELLNVHVKGNVECCQAAISPFGSKNCSTSKT